MEDYDNDYRIDASPTEPSGSYSKRSQRRRRTCTTIKPANPVDLEELLFEADRLDCLRAQQEPVRVRAVPASQNFISLQLLLETEQLPNDEPQTETEPKTLKQFSIVQEILHDFCASPSYTEEEELSPSDSLPWFRFRNKPIKTYNRQSAGNKSEIAYDEDRLSCSSELSVQEDFNTQVPTRTHCSFDGNSSQKICENLLNLSAFFTQQNNANKSIDLPDLQIELKECTLLEPIEYDELEDATDLLMDMGYFIGDTEQCKYLDDNCDNKSIGNAEISLFNERSRLLLAKPPSKDNNPRDAHLCGDWFDGDFNTQELTKKENKDANLATANAIEKSKENESKLDDMFDGIPLSEWQPIEIGDSLKFQAAAESNVKPKESGSNRASNRKLEVSKENQKKAAELMADLKASYSQKLGEDSKNTSHSEISKRIEFRTASNKTVKLTEEMRKKAAMLMADLEASSVTQPEPKEDCAQLNAISGFRTASNKSIEVTQQMQRAAANLLADLEINNQPEKEVNASDCEMLDGIPLSEWQPMDIPNSSKHAEAETDTCNQFDMIAFSEWPPMEISDAVEFRTASNKAIEVSEEKQADAAKLMADLDASYSQKLSQERNERNQLSEKLENIEFRTAANKTLKLTEEMRKKAAELMADLGTDCNQLDMIQTAEFRTASNKAIEVSEEKLAEAARLMADLEVSYSQKVAADCDGNLHSENLENIKYRTDEMQSRAAMLMSVLETDCSQLDDLKMEDCPPKPISESPKGVADEEAAGNVLADIKEEIPGPPSEANNGGAYIITATPLPSKLSSEIKDVPFETPKCTPELQSSMTQLTEHSPLDRATKSSIISRRNLLSLNKRRKQKRDSENCSLDAGQTPLRQRFAPMAASTSTPVPNRDENVKEDLNAQCTVRDRSCSQDSPRVQRTRVGKRRSEDALSPIYAPTNKTRRLGLSRIRNKSSHDI